MHNLIINSPYKNAGRRDATPENPTMMNVITHGYLSSRVPAIDTFEQIIKYAKSHNEVWFARRGDIAAWARKYYEDT